MNHTIAARLLAAASVLMLLSGCIFGIARQWIYAALVWAGAFGCLAAALNFKTRRINRFLKIETNRLFLRELTMDDLAALYTILADSDIMQHYPYTFDESRVRRWIDRNIKRYKTDGFGLWAVCLKENSKMIGDCGLTLQNINGQIKPEIGYHIAKAYQRRGYAKEAAQAVRDWAFENTDFDTLYSYMKAANLPSIAVASANGMTFMEEYTDSEGEQTAVYGVSRKNWEGKAQ